MSNNIKAEIVAHSVNQQGDELISVLCTFPRIILAEVNTHRMLSKNTSSSRAIPFNKMVQAIQDNPFIPIAWQKEHSGMQGTEYITDPEHIKVLLEDWNTAKVSAVANASMMNIHKVTKQLANRLLEPFMWTTMLITGSKEGWDNFFHLRCPSYELEHLEGTFKSGKDAIKAITTQEISYYESACLDDMFWLKRNTGQAEIHMMALAETIWDAKNESTPKLLKPGEWHIPFEDKIKEFTRLRSNAALVQISTAMGARTSYTVIGEEKEINHETLIGLHDRLITQQPPHSSPMEHCSRAMNNDEYDSFYKGKCYIGISEKEEFSNMGWCYNHKGFIPYRYLIDNDLTL